MKVTVRLVGDEASRVEALVGEARRRALARLESQLVARAERARLLRAMRDTRRTANGERS